MVDLSDAPVIDTHLHGWRTSDLLDAPADGFAERVTMLGMCVLTSGGDPATFSEVLARATASTPMALALLARLGEQLGCEPTNEAVSAARLERLRADATGYLQELWRDARIEGLVVDEGFPLPIIPGAELEREAGVPVHRVVRIEPWIAEERDAAEGYDELEDALSARLEAAAADGAIAFKSVIAYRTGLDITHPSAGRCARSVHALAPGRLPRDARARQARARPVAGAHARGGLGHRRARAHPLRRRRPRQPRPARPPGRPLRPAQAPSRTSPCC